MSNCVFCDILAGKLPASIVYQDASCTAFMDIEPINPGHVLVIPNGHAPSLAALSEEAGDQLFRTARRIAGALFSSGIRCEGVNLLLADGAAAGQEVFHIHLHVLPRYRDDGFGYNFNLGDAKRPERAALDALAQQIGNELS
jgi:histidine triad (HIT) family protein